MGHDDVKIENRTRPFDGYFKIDRYTISHRRFGGGWTPPFDRELLERGHAVVVLLYDPNLDTVVLVEQFRIGAFAAARNSPWLENDESPWLIECVAGIIDAGETPEAVAHREAMEEAGCTVSELIPIQKTLVSPGGCTETVFLFCGITDASNAGGVFGLEHENEDIRVHAISSDLALEWLDTGRILQSTTMICLYWLREHRDQFKNHR